MATTFRVEQVGGREMRRSLDAIHDGLGKQLTTIRRDVSDLIAGRARPRMRYGPGPRLTSRNADNRLPHIRDTISGQARGVVSTHPGAIVWEYGGTIAPSGSPIRIPALEMAQGAAAASSGDIDRIFSRRIDELINANT